MKITIAQQDLAKALSIGGKAVSTKTTLPVLSFLKLEATQAGGFFVSSTNLETAVRIKAEGATVLEDGEVCAPARLFNDFVAGIDSKATITLELDIEKYVLKVSSTKFNANLNCIAAEDFPALPLVANAINTALIPVSVIKMLVHQVAFAASKDETRPILTGMFLSFSGKTVEAACADSFRLSVRKMSLEATVEDDFKIVVPASSLSLLVSIIQADEGEVTLTTNAQNSQALFTFGNFEFTTSLVEGNFPNYIHIIPKKSDTTVTVSNTALLSAIKSASLFAKSASNIIRLKTEVTDGVAKLIITSRESEIGDSRSEVVCESIEGDVDAEIAMNSGYMLDVLKAAVSTNVRLLLQSPSNPLLLQPAAPVEFSHVIMPMHLANSGPDRSRVEQTPPDAPTPEPVEEVAEEVIVEVVAEEAQAAEPTETVEEVPAKKAKKTKTAPVTEPEAEAVAV